MKIFLAGENGRKQITQDIIHATVLGSGRPVAERGGYDQYIRDYHPFILESFFYCDADTERLLPYYGDFLLDSGAFTFMQGSGTADFDNYVERYADFINRNHIEKYFLKKDIEGADMVYLVTDQDREGEAIAWHLKEVLGLQKYKRMPCYEYTYKTVKAAYDNAGLINENLVEKVVTLRHIIQ